MNQPTRSVYVIGHKNPDTDSICSAIAYAELKNKLNQGGYKAKRAGHISAETQFILDYFKVTPPEYLGDVKLRVRDIDVHFYSGVEPDISLKSAWEHMAEQNVVTIPIVQKSKLKGLITLGDITKAYMNVFDNEIIGAANTPYRNIVETLDGDMVVGNIEGHIKSGKVLISAANPDLMEDYIEEGDLVILGNRYESQLCAIEMLAQCIIVCEGALVSKTITKLAEENNCTIIRTPYDTYTVARLINQSMPISHFMTSNALVTFTREDYIDDIREIMAKKRYRDFPILDKDGDFHSMISRRNLLDVKRRKVILVDHNERSQAVEGLEDAEILEVIDHHRIGSLETINPVYFRNQPVGCTSTIIYQMYKEHNIAIDPPIAGLLCSAILSDTLVFRSPTCTLVDKEAAQVLAQIAGIDIETYAIQMFTAGSNVLSKSPEEIFYQDFKQFTAGEVVFGVGQITAMTNEELTLIKQKLMPYIEQVYRENKLPMFFIMLTNIMEESTELLYKGNGAYEILQEAFQLSGKGDKILLPGVVSRKKQLIPALVTTLQQ